MKKYIIILLLSIISLSSCSCSSYAQVNEFYNSIRDDFNNIIIDDEVEVTDENKLECSLRKLYGLSAIRIDPLNSIQQDYMDSYVSSIRDNLSESEKKLHNNKLNSSEIESISELVFECDNASINFEDDDDVMDYFKDYTCSLKQEVTIFGIQDKSKGDCLRSCNKNSLIKPRPTKIYNCETTHFTTDTTVIANFTNTLCYNMDNSFLMELETQWVYYTYTAAHPISGYNHAYEITYKNGLVETLFFYGSSEGPDNFYYIYRFYTPTFFSESYIIIDSSVFDNILEN